MTDSASRPNGSRLNVSSAESKRAESPHAWIQHLDGESALRAIFTEFGLSSSNADLHCLWLAAQGNPSSGTRHQLSQKLREAQSRLVLPLICTSTSHTRSGDQEHGAFVALSGCKGSIGIDLEPKVRVSADPVLRVSKSETEKTLLRAACAYTESWAIAWACKESAFKAVSRLSQHASARKPIVAPSAEFGSATKGPRVLSDIRLIELVEFSSHRWACKAQSNHIEVEIRAGWASAPRSNDGPIAVAIALTSG